MMASGRDSAMQSEELQFLQLMQQQAIAVSDSIFGEKAGEASVDGAKVRKCVVDMDHVQNTKPYPLYFDFDDHTMMDIPEIELHQVHEEYKGAKPNHVMITGEPGSGKTALAKQYVGMVSSGQVEALKDIKLAAFVSAYKLISEEDTHAFDVLIKEQLGFEMESHIRTAGMEFILNHSDQTLLVIDGLDQCFEPFGETSYAFEVNNLLSGILRGNIWPGIKTVFTGRPFLFWRLTEEERPDKVVALRGFDSLNLEKAISNMVPSSCMQKILEHLNDKEPALLATCGNPAFLTFFVREFERCNGSFFTKTIPATVPSLMACRLISLCKEYGYSAVQKVAATAYQGVWNREFTFKNDFLEHFGNLCVSYRCGLFDGTLREFSHRTMQELLAAIHVFSLKKRDLRDVVARRLNESDMTFVREIVYGLANDQNAKDYANEYYQATGVSGDVKDAVLMLTEHLEKFVICGKRITGMEVSLLSTCGYSTSQDKKKRIESIEIYDWDIVPFSAHHLSLVVQRCKSRPISECTVQRIEPVKSTVDSLLRCFPGLNKFKANIVITDYVNNDYLGDLSELLMKLEIESLLLTSSAELKHLLLKSLDENVKIIWKRLFVRGETCDDSFRLIGKIMNKRFTETVGFDGVNASAAAFYIMSSKLDPGKHCKRLVLENCKSVDPPAYAELAKLAVKLGPDDVLLRDNDLDENKLGQFREVIASETMHIHRLVIKGDMTNPTSFHELRIICNAMKIKELEFHDADLTMNKLVALSRVEAGKKDKLDQLVIKGCKLDREAFCELPRAIHSFRPRVLQLHDIHFTMDKLEVFKETASSAKVTVERLSLKNCRILDTETSHFLAKSIKSLNTKELIFHGLALTEKLWKAFSNAASESVMRLNTFTLIGDTDLARGSMSEITNLCKSTNLSELTLARCNMTPIKLRLLGICFTEKNLKIKALRVTDDPTVSEASMDPLTSIVKNSGISLLSISNCYPTKPKLKSLLDSIKDARAYIRTVDLSHNGFVPDSYDIEALTELFPHVRKVSLDGWDLKQEHLDVLQKGLDSPEDIATDEIHLSDGKVLKPGVAKRVQSMLK